MLYCGSYLHVLWVILLQICMHGRAASMHSPFLKWQTRILTDFKVFLAYRTEAKRTLNNNKNNILLATVQIFFTLQKSAPQTYSYDNLKTTHLPIILVKHNGV